MDPEGAAGRQAASPLPARRRQPRPLPVRDLAYAHLSLPGLRGYRTALGTEESRVSYWRRILQARLDVVRAGAQGSLDSAHLRPVLTDARVGSGRRALVEVLDQGDIPRCHDCPSCGTAGSPPTTRPANACSKAT